MRGKLQLIVPILNVLVGANFSFILISSELPYIFSQSILRFFLFSLMTKPLNTQNEWIILTLIRAVAGFCLLSLDV